MLWYGLDIKWLYILWIKFIFGLKFSKINLTTTYMCNLKTVCCPLTSDHLTKSISQWILPAAELSGNAGYAGADLGGVWGVQLNPLNWNRWRQRNCKILIRVAFCLKKRDLKTPWHGLKKTEIAWTGISKFPGEDAPGLPYRGMPSAVLISSPFCEILDLPQGMDISQSILFAMIVLYWRNAKFGVEALWSF